MAHLPPKAPNMTQNWSDHHFPHRKMENLPINSPSWADDFLDFSSSNTRRGSHKRSMSDSIAFLDTPMVEQCRKFGHHEFERFDDEQLISMFNDDDVHVGVGPTVSCSNPSSPSDHNSMNDQDEKQLGPSDHFQKLGLNPKSEPDEVESSCKSEGLSDNSHANLDSSGEKIVDPKRIKRILANRQSAQRSRVRKLHYISDLERSVNSLQAEVSVLSPRVAFLDHQRLVLNVDNSVLKQRIAALAQDKVFKDAHQEALKREIERLRQIYYQQNLKNMENVESQSKPADTNCFIDKEQLAVN